MSDPTAVLGLEPDDLDGHTIDELVDYLERGREPGGPSIDNSPACQIALGALQRLQRLTHALLDDPDPDADAPNTDQDWISAVLAAIPVDARSGRHFPWPADDPRLTAHTTEGAVRGLVRAIGDGVPGLLVGSVRIGDEQPARLRIDVALVHGVALPPAVARLRSELAQALPDHLPIPIGAVDIAVVGLIQAPTRGDRP